MEGHLSIYFTGKLSESLLVFRGCSLLREVVCGGDQESWPWAARVTEQPLQMKLSIGLLCTILHSPSHKHQGCSDVLAQLQSNGQLNLALHIAVECEQCGSQTSLISSLLEKALNQMDHSSGLTLLLATPHEEALRLLHARQAAILSSYSRVIALSTLTIDYCHLVCLPQVKSTASFFMSGAVWGKFLRKYEITFSFGRGPEERKEVLRHLLQEKRISPGVVLAYCRTYELNGTGSLLTRLRLILTEWKDGYQEGFAANLACVKSHPFISSLLNTFLSHKVCPYDYERIQFVLQKLCHTENPLPLHGKIQQLLSVLADYGERSPASEQERSWHTANCHAACRAGEPISPRRLPLHMLLDPTLALDLICYEARNNSPLDKLLALAGYLNFPEERLYQALVRSLDTRKMSYHELAPLLAAISDTTTRLILTSELATSLSGSDQVAALEMVLELAAETSGHHLDIQAIQRELQEAKTRVLLEGAGLDRYVAAFDASVISSLYTELPLQQERPAPAAVHQIAQEVAGIHGVNMLALSSQILQEWLLPSATGQQELNSTFVRELAEVENMADTANSNWSRMVYLLTDHPHIDHLVTVLFNLAKIGSAVVGAVHRQHALQLLLTAVPQSVVERVTGVSLVALREKIKGAIFVVELAAVGLSLTPEELETHSKQCLVSSLLQSQGTSPKALRLAAELCLHYQVLDHDLWASILSALLKMKMIRFLQTLLPKLTVLQLHCSVANISSVWQAVVQASYERGGGSDFLPALHLLYQCPVLQQLDLHAIVQTMARAGAHSHALSASLLLTSSSARSSSVESVLDGLSQDRVLQLLEEVSTSSCTQLLLVAGELYSYVDRRGQYEWLLGSHFFSCLVEHLIIQNQLSSLLTYVLSRGRVSEAVQLVDMYHTQHCVSAPAGIEGLKVYLKTQNVDNIESIDFEISV